MCIGTDFKNLFMESGKATTKWDLVYRRLTAFGANIEDAIAIWKQIFGRAPAWTMKANAVKSKLRGKALGDSKIKLHIS